MVSIPINFNEVEIGVVLITVQEKKIEIRAVPTAIMQRNLKFGKCAALSKLLFLYINGSLDCPNFRFVEIEKHWDYIKKAPSAQCEPPPSPGLTRK